MFAGAYCDNYVELDMWMLPVVDYFVVGSTETDNLGGVI